MPQAEKPPVTIRRMKIEELDEIQSLYALQTEADDNPLTAIRINAKQHAWEMRRLRQQLITEQRYMAFVATIENEDHSETFVGYTAAIIEQQARLFAIENVASINELWVLPEHRSRGIGKALVEELFGAINDRGIEWITVHFPQKAEDAMTFFKKIGFEQKSVDMQIHLNIE